MTIENDRIKGVLLGQAAGDALGSQYEFGPPSNGHAVMGRGTFGHAPGEYTDDTQQAVCVARGRSQPEAVARNLLAWFKSGPADVGNQTRSVLSRASNAATMTAAAREYVEKSAAITGPGWDPGSGNGSLMRTGPVCLPYLGDHVAVVRAAREVSSRTHATEHDQDACAIWSLAIESAIMLPAGFTTSRFDGLLELAVPGSRREFWRGTVDEALASEPAAFRRNGSAVGAFKCALSAVARSTSLRTAFSSPSTRATTRTRWRPSRARCWVRCTARARSRPPGVTSCTGGRTWTPAAWRRWRWRQQGGIHDRNRYAAEPGSGPHRELRDTPGHPLGVAGHGHAP